MVLTSSTSIPVTLWCHDKPGLPDTSQEHLSADQPPQASVLSTRVLNAVNHQSCSNDSTKPLRTKSLVLFSSPPPLQTTTFKLCSYSSPWWWYRTQQEGDEKRFRSILDLPCCETQEHRLWQNTQEIIFPRSSHSNISPVTVWISYLRHSTASRTHLWKMCPSFPHVDLGKGNKMDMLDVQGKYIMLVCTSGRF